MITRCLQPLQTLHIRVLMALALIAILPLGITGLGIAAMDRGALAEQSSRELTGLARGLAGQLSTFLDGALNNAQGFAALPQIVSMDPAQQKPLLDELFHRHPEFSTLVTFDPSGQVLVSTPPRNLPGAAEREAFQSAAVGGRQDWMIVRGIDTKRSILLMHTPIRDTDRRVVGVLGATVDLENLSSVVGKVPVGGGGQAFVLDPSGQVLLHKDRQVVQERPSFSRLGVASGGLPVGAGTVRYESDEGPKIAGYAPVPDTGWMVVVDRPEKEVLAVASRSWQLAVLGLLVSAAIALVAAAIIASLLTRPLRQMALAVRAAGAGDWNTPLPESRAVKGELGTLLEAFSNMRKQVQAREESLQLLAQEKTDLAGEKAAMAEIGRIISSTLDINEVYSSFAAQVRRLIPWDRISISLVGPEAGTFTSTYYDGIKLPGRERGAVSPLPGSLMDEVLQTGSGLLVQDENADEIRHKFPTISRSFEAGLRSFIAVPLVSKHEVIGALHLRSLKANAYSEQHLWLAEQVGTQIAGAVANAQLYRLRQQAEEALRVAEQEVRERAAELARSNAELEQFAYIASHDLQEPLRSITGFTSLLTRRYQGQLGDDADRFITRIVEATARMQRLINDLLTYSRVGRQIKFQPTDCHSLVGQEIAGMHAAIQEGGALVSCYALPTVMADPALLVQVFRNLIGNAIKFRGQEPPKVQISAEEKGDHWVFAVRDNGIGIEPEYRERIFTIFERLHSMEEYPGTGIGLSICKKAVERWGGQIWVESQPGQGSSFYFTVPMTPVESQPVNPGLVAALQ